MKKDFYKILDISEEEKSLPFDEFKEIIKKKYRKISMECHPDKNMDKSDDEKKILEDKFKEISEAYSILSDEQKKLNYDRGDSFSSFGGQNFDMRDFFRQHMEMNDIFNGFMNNNNYGFGYNQTQRNIIKGQTIQVKLNITLEELYDGCKKNIKYNIPKKCDTCNGTCLSNNGERCICDNCGGSGFVAVNHGYIRVNSTCTYCGGSGEIIKNPCLKCYGKGLIAGEKTTEIEIQPGLLDGSTIMIRGAGGEINDVNGINGDLIIHINELSHNNFIREGNNLIMEMQVSIIDGILGSELEIQPLKGNKIKFKIPQSSAHDSIFRIQGKGMPIHQTNNNYGDLLIIIKHKLPKTLNNQEIKLLQKLNKTENFQKLKNI